MLHFGCLGAGKEVKIQLQNMANPGVLLTKVRKSDHRLASFLSF